jgi:hypothetical protein
MSSMTPGVNAGIFRMVFPEKWYVPHGILHQIEAVENGLVKTKPLTMAQLEEFLNELSKKEMSRKNKRPQAKEVSEETIKSLFELYKPNKVQLFIMKWVGLNAPFTGNNKRVILLAELLGLTVDKILEYELKFYLNGKGYTF